MSLLQIRRKQDKDIQRKSTKMADYDHVWKNVQFSAFISKNNSQLK